jgi:hypothetical protein
MPAARVLQPPGDKIEVKVTATGFSGSYRPWQVRFRY